MAVFAGKKGDCLGNVLNKHNIKDRATDQPRVRELEGCGHEPCVEERRGEKVGCARVRQKRKDIKPPMSLKGGRRGQGITEHRGGEVGLGGA